MKTNIWRLWAKSLGEKATSCSKESDKVAIIRTVIFSTYLITNLFIIFGVTRTHIFPAETKSIKCIIVNK